MQDACIHSLQLYRIQLYSRFREIVSSVWALQVVAMCSYVDFMICLMDSMRKNRSLNTFPDPHLVDHFHDYGCSPHPALLPLEGVRSARSHERGCAANWSFPSHPRSPLFAPRSPPAVHDGQHRRRRSIGCPRRALKSCQAGGVEVLTQRSSPARLAESRS